VKTLKKKVLLPGQLRVIKAEKTVEESTKDERKEMEHQITQDDDDDDANHQDQYGPRVYSIFHRLARNIHIYTHTHTHTHTTTGTIRIQPGQQTII
jgi:hypothetical protein